MTCILNVDYVLPYSYVTGTRYKSNQLNWYSVMDMVLYSYEQLVRHAFYCQKHTDSVVISNTMDQ